MQTVLQMVALKLPQIELVHNIVMNEFPKKDIVFHVQFFIKRYLNFIRTNLK